MEPAALLTFVLIGGFVWGGLILILATALRKERGKMRDSGVVGEE